MPPQEQQGDLQELQVRFANFYTTYYRPLAHKAFSSSWDDDSALNELDRLAGPLLDRISALCEGNRALNKKFYGFLCKPLRATATKYMDRVYAINGDLEYGEKLNEIWSRLQVIVKRYSPFFRYCDLFSEQYGFERHAFSIIGNVMGESYHLHRLVHTLVEYTRLHRARQPFRRDIFDNMFEMLVKTGRKSVKEDFITTKTIPNILEGPMRIFNHNCYGPVEGLWADAMDLDQKLVLELELFRDISGYEEIQRKICQGIEATSLLELIVDKMDHLGEERISEYVLDGGEVLQRRMYRLYSFMPRTFRMVGNAIKKKIKDGVINIITGPWVPVKRERTTRVNSSIIELVENLSQHRRNEEVIIVTAGGNEEEIRKLYRSAMYDAFNVIEKGRTLCRYIAYMIHNNVKSKKRRDEVETNIGNLVKIGVCFKRENSYQPSELWKYFQSHIIRQFFNRVQMGYKIQPAGPSQFSQLVIRHWKPCVHELTLMNSLRKENSFQLADTLLSYYTDIQQGNEEEKQLESFLNGRRGPRPSAPLSTTRSQNTIFTPDRQIIPRVLEAARYKDFTLDVYKTPALFQTPKDAFKKMFEERNDKKLRWEPAFGLVTFETHVYSAGAGTRSMNNPPVTVTMQEDQFLVLHQFSSQRMMSYGELKNKLLLNEEDSAMEAIALPVILSLMMNNYPLLVRHSGSGELEDWHILKRNDGWTTNRVIMVPKVSRD